MQKVQASVLRKYLQTPMPKTDDFLFWDELLESFSFPLLIFLLSAEARKRFPYKQLGYREIQLGSITPARNESWILFSFQVNSSPESPICSDGLMLPCEWRKTEKKSQLLPESLHQLAKRVTEQIGVQGWNLYPSFTRFGDRIDFSDESLFASVDEKSLIASAWSSLAIGLYYATHEIIPSHWPFTSMQYNFEENRVEAVAGLEKKIRIANFFHANEFLVAKSQIPEAKKILTRGIRFVAAPTCKNVNTLIADLALGVLRQRKKKLYRLISFVSILIFLVSCIIGGYFVWYHPVHTYYAIFFNNRQQLFRGEHQIKFDDAENRIGNYRFTRKGIWGSLVEIAIVDGLERYSTFGTLDPLVSGRLISNSRNDLQRTVRIKISGHEATGYDPFGNKTYSFVCNDVGDQREYRFQDAGGGNIVSGNVCYVKMNFDKNKGDMTSLRYYDQKNRPTTDINNVYGLKCDYSAQNGYIILSQIFFDETMKKIRGTEGYCQLIQKFSSLTHSLLEQKFCDEKGNAVVTTRGLAGTSYEYKGSENPSNIRNIDTQGNAVGTPLFPMSMDCSWKIGEGEYTFSEKWPMGITQTRIITVDTNGTKKREEITREWPNGIQTHSVSDIKYQNSGHRVFQSNASRNGYRWYEYQTNFDNKGRVVKNIRLAWKDPDRGKELKEPETTTWEYSEFPGREGWSTVIRRHWMNNGEKFDIPTMRHCSKAVYMQNELIHEIKFYDENEKNAEQEESGLKFHKRIFEYHYGFMKKVSNYDLQEKLCSGVFPAEITREYDNRNMLIREFFHRGNVPMVHPQTGFCEIRYQFDSNTGVLKETRFYDVNGKLIDKKSNFL